MGQADQHHLGGGDRAARRFNLGDAFEQHLPVGATAPAPRDPARSSAPRLRSASVRAGSEAASGTSLSPRHQMS